MTANSSVNVEYKYCEAILNGFARASIIVTPNPEWLEFEAHRRAKTASQVEIDEIKVILAIAYTELESQRVSLIQHLPSGDRFEIPAAQAIKEANRLIGSVDIESLKENLSKRIQK